jgi:ribonuclease P protein component
LQRLKTWAQFQAVLAGATIAKSEHFALHRNTIDAKSPEKAGADTELGYCLPCTDPKNQLREGLPRRAETRETLHRPAGVRLLFPTQDLWLGAMVPKRWAKRSATRNAIKRQIYAVSANFSPKHKEAAFVVRLRRDFSRQAFPSASSDFLKQAVRKELQALLQEGARRA